jgi:hypothetical protein
VFRGGPLIKKSRDRFPYIYSPKRCNNCVPKFGELELIHLMASKCPSHPNREFGFGDKVADGKAIDVYRAQIYHEWELPRKRYVWTTAGQKLCCPWVLSEAGGQS